MKNSSPDLQRIIVCIILMLTSVPVFSQGSKPEEKSTSDVAAQKSSEKEVNIKDFGAKGDGVTNDIPAFEAAKKVIKKHGGGTIYFPVGKYMSGKNGWNVYASNITLRGDGIDKTFLLTPNGTSAPGLRLAPYRDAGWDNSPELQYTYENNAKEGDRFIKLKAGQNANRFKVGTVFFLSAGASHYDQYYGEFNIVDRVDGNTLFLRYPLGRDYTVETSAWYGTLAKDFFPPDIGDTATAKIINGPGRYTYPNTISLNNELYEVVKEKKNNEVVLRNLGKGNQNVLLPAGMKVFKGRSIRITPSATFNVVVKDMTIDGHRKAVIVSNSVKIKFNRVKFIWHPGSDNGGIWLDGDDGRDCVLESCSAESDRLVTSQFARSFSDIKIMGCSFRQTSLDFTEFNFNYEVANCTFQIQAPADNNKFLYNAAITVGASTYNGSVHDNIIKVTRRVAAISSQPDIQIYSRNHLYKADIRNNTIELVNCGNGISVGGLGEIHIEKNIIKGSLTNSIFGGSGVSMLTDETLSASERSHLLDKVVCYIRGNTFEGYANGFFASEPNHIVIEDNTVTFQKEFYKDVGKKYKDIGLGSILQSYKSSDSSSFMFVFKNNTFKNWNYRNNSVNFSKAMVKGSDISNNRIVNNTGAFKEEKSFLISSPK